MTELPTDWELRTLSDCLETLKSGKKAERGWSPQCLSHPSKNENTWGVLKTTSVQMGEFQPEYNKELPESLEPKSGLEVIEGDFLVTTTGPRNRCGIVCHVKKTRKKLIFSGKILRFRVNESVILPNWLMYLLMSPEYQSALDRMKVGTSDSSVSIGNQQILDLEIPVPPIEEQHKIVALLEEHLSRLDVALADVKQSKIKAAQFRRSLLQSTFLENLVTNNNRSSSITFDDAFEIGNVGRKAVKQRDYLHNGKFPVIDQGEDFISGYSNEKSLVLDFKKPVIIFGDHTRRIKYVNFPFIPGADGTKILVPNVALDSAFACYQLQSKELRDKGYARHFSELRKERFWIPPMNEQLKIVEHLDGLFSRLNSTVTLSDALEKQATGLRRSLLQAAFTGQLTNEVVSV